MTKSQQESAAQTPDVVTDGRPSGSFGGRGFVRAVVLLIVCFSVPLYQLARFAVGSEVYSFIFLIPFISWYLVWMRRDTLPGPSQPMRKLAAFFFTAGLALIVLYWFSDRSAPRLVQEDRLALTTFSFFLFFVGVCCAFLGKETLRAVAFPIGFLAFITPFPTIVMDSFVAFLQHASAATASAMFQMVGTPVFRSSVEFRLPGMSLEVAPECSGIHSTLVLLITSLIGGYVFLDSGWKRTCLAVAVIPLAILRNSFRIFTIGELCVHVGPEMIHSYIHKRGGPIFFVLSLIPFFLLLSYLRKSRGKDKQG